MSGIDTKTVQVDAVRAMLIAENGKASGSSTIAAVPRPCAAEPIANPRAIGSSTLHLSSMLAPKFAPNKPVTTTIETAALTSVPRIPDMAIAKGLVIFRERHANLSNGLVTPNILTATAVPKRPPTEETNVATVTSAMFVFTRFRLEYIESARLITEGLMNEKGRK